MASKGTWRLSSQKDPRWNASGETAAGDPATLSALSQQAVQALRTALRQEPPDDLTTEVHVAPAAETRLTDRPAPATTYGFAEPDPLPPAPVRLAGPPRCPSCGERVLPMQSRCLRCNTRLIQQVLPATDSEAVQTQPPAPAHRGAAGCPGCGAALGKDAVLCIQCGYDTRTGKRRQTRRLTPVEQREPLPPVLSQVNLGLGFHYAQLILYLLSHVGLLGLLLYALSNRPGPDGRPDITLGVGGMAVAGLFVLQAILGIIGSTLCALVPAESGAKWVILLSLLLDVAVIPFGVYLVLAELPTIIAGAVSFVSWMLFMVFLMRLAYYIHQNGLGHEAGGKIVRGLALFVLVPLMIVLLGMLAVLSVVPPWVFGFGAVVLGIGDLFFLIHLAFNLLGVLLLLRESIRHGLARSRVET